MDQKAIGPNQYLCECCGNIFNKGWTDEEAIAEFKEHFPNLDPNDPDEAGLVCDVCYKMLGEHFGFLP